MLAGATDLVTRGNTDHFRLTIEREFSSLQNRRHARYLERSLIEVEKRCQSLLDSSRDSIAYIHEGMHIYANQSYLEKFGFNDFDEIEGLPLLDLIAPCDQPEFKEFLRKYTKGERSLTEIRVKMKYAQNPSETQSDPSEEGTEPSATIKFSAASVEGEPCTQIIIQEQAFMNEELEKQLANLSRQDMLTGLWNRQYFLEHLDHFVSNMNEQDNRTHSVFFILLDNYRAIKEGFGLAASDIFVGNIAKTLKDLVPEGDLLARFGDSSFIYLCHAKTKEAIHDQAELIRSTIEEFISDINGKAITSTCSIGAITFSETLFHAQDYINLADQACSAAREQGGNKTYFHQPSIAHEGSGEVDDRNWQLIIDESIEQQRFFLVFQPIPSLHGDPLERYEVRLRLRLDDDIVKPLEFIPFAEKSGQMIRLDRYILSESLRKLADHRSKGNETLFFIKVSECALEDSDFIPFLQEQIAVHQLETQHLVFEFSEPMILSKLNASKDLATQLAELNFKIAIDQFGMGLNPFQMLKHIPVHYLKIDPSYTQELTSNQENQDKIRNLVTNGHEMDKKLIAPHVEDAMTLSVLWQSQVDFVQGYFLQGPEPDMNHDFSGFSM
jgi:diguanylate cyclase (GGDEF)-like protein/PAS domain S-box-containing protein